MQPFKAKEGRERQRQNDSFLPCPVLGGIEPGITSFPLKSLKKIYFYLFFISRERGREGEREEEKH